MELKKFFRNPEVKRTTIKFLIILVLGGLSILLAARFISNRINNIIIDQNTVIYFNILEGKDNGQIISNFYNITSKEKLEEAEEILKSYGYDKNISSGAQDLKNEIEKFINLIFLIIYIVFLGVMYMLFLRELNSIYKQIEKVVLEIGTMSEGKYKKIQGTFNEGEMAILISSLDYMGDRVNNSIELLRQDKEYLKDFLSDISHQLKTPLASLIMFNDLMKENENMPYEDRVKFLEKCDEQLSRMEWLIMNILKVGRLDAGAIKFEIFKQPLRDTIDIAISSLKEEAKRKKQKLILEGDLDTEIIHDRDWLAEAISNIIKNAIEHTQEGGKIEVKVDKGPIITKIIIKDNGPGISEDMQKKVFKRFYKGENSTNPKSIGIGLSLAKSIIEEQGGEIKLLSKEGEGTTFILSFMDSLK